MHSSKVYMLIFVYNECHQLWHIQVIPKPVHTEATFKNVRFPDENEFQQRNTWKTIKEIWPVHAMGKLMPQLLSSLRPYSSLFLLHIHSCSLALVSQNILQKDNSRNRSCYWVFKVGQGKKHPRVVFMESQPPFSHTPCLTNLISLPSGSLTFAIKSPRGCIPCKSHKEKRQSVSIWGQDHNSGNTCLGRTSMATEQETTVVPDCRLKNS